MQVMFCRTDKTIDEAIHQRKRDPMLLFKWLSDNQMKISISNCHLLVKKMTNLP